ncbi:MAG: AraC family transcriptional regulator [Terrimicrobiaceae bacterium]
MVKHWRSLVPDGNAYHISVALDHGRMPIAYHGHDFAEVFWVEEGRGIHHLNGRRIEIQAGDLVFIRPSDKHGLLTINGGVFRLCNVAFPRSVPTRLCRTYFPDEAGWFWAQDSSPHSIAMDAEQREALQAECDWLRGAPRDLLSLDNFLLNLFRLLGRAHAPHDNRPDWLDAAMRGFGSAEHLADGVQRFFRMAGRCPEHVARTMQRHCGTTPTAWVNARRVEYAARLLESTMLPVTEVAFRCGFENLAYFHRLFRASHGTTPRSYRTRQHAVM